MSFDQLRNNTPHRCFLVLPFALYSRLHLIIMDSEDEDANDYPEDYEPGVADSQEEHLLLVGQQHPSQGGSTDDPPESDSDEEEEVDAVVTEKQDLLATIEHLVVVGNHHRHQRWRLDQWKQSRESSAQIAQQKQSSNPAAEKGERAPKTKGGNVDDEDDDDHYNASLWIHDQDRRMYNIASNHNQEIEPWPRPGISLGKKRAPDYQWDEELSDGIHPVSFQKIRLSGCTDESASLADDYDLDLTTLRSNIDLQKEQVHEAMLLLCWERAMHAASTTFTHSQTKSLPVPPESAMVTRDAALEACDEYMIAIPFSACGDDKINEALDGVDNYKGNDTHCPICKIEVSNREKLEHHFLGTDTTPGCCWIEVDRRRRSLVFSMLKSELQNQVDQIMHLVLLHDSPRKMELAKEEGRPQQDCFDVLRILETTLTKSSSTVVQNSTHEKPMQHLETLRYQPDKPPLVLNWAILDAFRSRIVDRYAKIPR
jgi:hypothetical protein